MPALIASSLSNDELENYVSEATEVALPDDATFVCASCDGVAGYYSTTYQVIGCPHCEGDAYPLD